MSASSETGSDALLADTAKDLPINILSTSKNVLKVCVHLQRPSGRTVNYTLRTETGGREPRVREDPPRRLPGYCPNRHIGGNGYFCLGFSPLDPLPVHDTKSAETWWARLWKYLALQETTTTLRRWPSNSEWAHDIAAVHQASAERCAATLGPRYAEALGRRRLNVRRRKNAPAFLQLRDGETRLYSVWRDARRVATLRQHCFCGSGRALVACGDHATSAAELVFALLDWKRAEDEFWKSLKDQVCCGTLKDCPLKTDAPANDDAAERAA